MLKKFNHSFELEKLGKEDDKFFNLSPKKRNQIFFVRRKSCHCSKCGTNTKFQQNNILLPGKIRFQTMQILRSKEARKTIKAKTKSPNAKKNSVLRFAPKKTSKNAIFILNHLFPFYRQHRKIILKSAQHSKQFQY